MDLVEKKDKIFISKKNKTNFWNDYLIQNHYNEYFNDLSSSGLDKEFNNKLNILVKSLNKLDTTEKGIMVDLLSNLINFYIENKINKEIEFSISRLFKNL